jgi:hypothetical protein
LGGGNPDLRPEESQSSSAGIIFAPPAVEGLRVSVDWTRIRKRDNVAVFPFAQDTFNNELRLPGIITRGPASGGFEVGPVTGFNGRSTNIARQTVEAYDFAADYRLDTASWGTFALSTLATRNVHNQTQASIGFSPIEGVGLIGAIPWQATASVVWEFRNVDLQWSTRWYDSYCLNTSCAQAPNTVEQGSIDIPSQAYHDLSAAYRFGTPGGSGLLDSFEVRLGIRNVFDKTPPITTVAPYYSTLGDPRISSYYIAVKKGFGN